MVEPQVADINERIKRALVEDKVYFSDHAKKRMDERLADYGLDELDVFRILKKGRREEDKDDWHSVLQEWTYAFRGFTVDGLELRVCVAIKPSNVLVVTVINLDLR